MLIQLPDNVWMDILDWLRAHRKEMALKFGQLGDRQFSEFTQTWLHGERSRRVKLHFLMITSVKGQQGNRQGNRQMKCANIMPGSSQGSGSRRSARLVASRDIEQFKYSGLSLDDQLALAVPFAETEVPANVQDFNYIQIGYLDSVVLKFLSKMRPLFNNVRLFLLCEENDKQGFATSVVLDHVLPLFTGGNIESIRCGMNAYPLLYYMDERYPAQLYGARILELTNHGSPMMAEVSELLAQWLFTKREEQEGQLQQQPQPRMLLINAYGPASLKILPLIMEQFLKAISPVNFFVRFRIRPAAYQVQYRPVPACRWQNDRTGEQLMVVKCAATEEEDSDDGSNVSSGDQEDNVDLLIGRCSSTIDSKQWLQAMDQKADEVGNREPRTFSIQDPKIAPSLFKAAARQAKEQTATTAHSCSLI